MMLPAHGFPEAVSERKLPMKCHHSAGVPRNSGRTPLFAARLLGRLHIVCTVASILLLGTPVSVAIIIPGPERVARVFPDTPQVHAWVAEFVPRTSAEYKARDIAFFTLLKPLQSHDSNDLAVLDATARLARVTGDEELLPLLAASMTNNLAFEFRRLLFRSHLITNAPRLRSLSRSITAVSALLAAVDSKATPTEQCRVMPKVLKAVHAWDRALRKAERAQDIHFGGFTVVPVSDSASPWWFALNVDGENWTRQSHYDVTVLYSEGRIVELAGKCEFTLSGRTYQFTAQYTIDSFGRYSAVSVTMWNGLFGQQHFSANAAL